MNRRYIDKQGRSALIRIATCLLLTFFFTQAHSQNEPSYSPEYWQSQIQTNPRNASNFLNLGVSYHRAEKYKEALKAYKRVIAMKSSLAPVANYYGAQIFVKLGKIDKAKEVLDRINVADLPENLRKRVLILKNTVYYQPSETEQTAEVEAEKSETEQKEKRYSLYLEASYGGNDNPAYATTKDNDTQTKWLASASYSVLTGDVYELKGAYVFSDTSYQQNLSSRSGYHDVTLPVAYYVEGSRLRIIPEYISTLYGGKSFSSSTGGAADLAFKMDQYYVTLYYQYLELDVSDATTYYYLRGHSGKTKLSVRTQWSLSQLTAALGYNVYGYEDTSSVTSSYKAPTFSLTYGMYFGDWDVTAYGSYEARTYSKTSSGTRKDGITTFSLQAGWSFSRYLRAFLDAGNSVNISTNSSYKYDQTTYTGGLSASF